MFKKKSHRLLLVDIDNRHIISMKSQGFSQTPQDIMKEYKGCSAPQTLPSDCIIDLQLFVFEIGAIRNRP